MRIIPAVILTSIAAVPTAHAQFMAKFEKVAIAGRPQRVTSVISLDPNCHQAAPPSAAILEAPRQGQVTIERGQAFPTFPSTNLRSKCNDRKVSALWITYTAASGASGDDDFTIELIDDLGNPRRAHYHVSIR